MKKVQHVVNKSKYNGDAHNFLKYGGYGSLQWYLEEGWVLKHIHIQGEAESVFAVFEKQVETIELYKYRELEAENQWLKNKLERAKRSLLVISDNIHSELSIEAEQCLKEIES